jgi:alanyl aminopeptidase
MAWWDDLWLNEAFASWMGENILDRFRPDWEVMVKRVRTRSDALRSDSLSSARKIRQPVESEHDTANLFDAITYGKGEAILAMFEAWLGPAPFRKGVQTYLDRHAWGNATAADFLRALSEAAGRDVAPVFSSFVDQTGAPVVSAALRCDGAPRVALSQRPYRRLGSPEAAKTWQIPVCVRTAAAAPACEVLGAKEGTLALRGACPTWDLPNAGMSGYFRVRMSGNEMLDALLPGRLSKAERVGLIGDVRALVDSGDLPAADALRVAAHEAQDEDHQVILALASIVDGLDQHVPEALRPRYAAFVRGLFAARARTLGWRARPGETDNTRLLRRSVLWRAAGLGRDPELGREAVALARQWLADPKAIDADMVDVVLPVAARHGDRSLFDAFAAEVKKSPDRARREALFEALGSFTEPALVDSALALSLDPAVDAREALKLIVTASRDAATRDRAYQFTKSHHDALVARLPGDVGGALPLVGQGLCDAAAKADLLATFKPSSTKLPGGPRLLDQALESIDLCMAARPVLQPSLEEFLASR